MLEIEARRAREEDRPDIARIIVRCFEEDFTGVTNDLAKLAKAMEGIIEIERFFVGLVGGGVVGVLACSDERGRAMSIHSTESLRHMDGFSGRIGAGNARPAYIEFVAVSEHARRMGVARRMISHAIDSTAYGEYLLYVSANNKAALNCYESFGFAELVRMPDEKNPSKGDRVYMGYVK